MTQNVKSFRAFDSKILAATYNTLAQMQDNIETIVRNSEVDGPEDLPHSLVPTQTLYEIALCYDVMYNLLVDDHLIKSGNPKHSSTTIH